MASSTLVSGGRESHTSLPWEEGGVSGLKQVILIYLYRGRNPNTMGLLGMYLYPAYNPACVSYNARWIPSVPSSLLRSLSELRSFHRFDPRVICTCFIYVSNREARIVCNVSRRGKILPFARGYDRREN